MMSFEQIQTTGLQANVLEMSHYPPLPLTLLPAPDLVLQISRPYHTPHTIIAKSCGSISDLAGPKMQPVRGEFEKV